MQLVLYIFKKRCFVRSPGWRPNRDLQFEEPPSPWFSARLNLSTPNVFTRAEKPISATKAAYVVFAKREGRVVLISRVPTAGPAVASVSLPDSAWRPHVLPAPVWAPSRCSGFAPRSRKEHAWQGNWRLSSFHTRFHAAVAVNCLFRSRVCPAFTRRLLGRFQQRTSAPG